MKTKNIFKEVPHFDIRPGDKVYFQASSWGSGRVDKGVYLGAFFSPKGELVSLKVQSETFGKKSFSYLVRLRVSKNFETMLGHAI